MARQFCLFLPLLLGTGAGLPAADPGALRIYVVEGDRAAHPPGTRVRSPLVVKITGDTGRPIADAIVSFLLPAAGSGGLFVNGLSTDIVRTGPDGLAAMPAVRWNTTPGPFEIKVTAAAGSARAGLMVPQSLGDSGSSMITVHPDAAAARPRRKWLVVVACVAGGSLAAGMALAKKPAASPSSSASPPSLSIGTPSITIGGPK